MDAMLAMTDAPVPLRDYVPKADQRILMRVGWAGYQALLALRPKNSPKLAFLDGVVELMTKAREHEQLKVVGRFLETYCMERGIEFNLTGEWTLQREEEDAACEPDESYIFRDDHAERITPDLVIEIVWTHGGLDKLEIYRRLGVREVWFWIDGAITVHALRDGAYTRVERSGWLPDLDLDLVARLSSVRPTSAAIQQFRAALT